MPLKKKTFFDHFQEAWNSRSRSTMKPWVKYVRLFRSALDKLPRAKDEVWQGMANDVMLEKMLTSKPPFLYSCLGSCSPWNNEVVDYLQKNVSKNLMIVGYKSVNGRSVTGYTADQMDEVIIWPGVKLTPKHYVIVKETSSIIVHLILGHGAYFADDPAKSHQYTVTDLNDDTRVIYYTKVLLGNVSHQSAPSTELVSAPLPYHSVVGKLNGFTEYIVYRYGQALPYLKITYTA
ncbi:unnamed protein product [Rotaria sp. Silwood1]|nr:unnamed protein product [Rotaria sp. Silwood1]